MRTKYRLQRQDPYLCMVKLEDLAKTIAKIDAGLEKIMVRVAKGQKIDAFDVTAKEEAK